MDKKKGCSVGCLTFLVVLILMIVLGSTEWVNWSNTQTADSPDAYRKYLEQFPAGKHAPEARKRLEGLPAEEARLWAEVTRNPDREALEAFLKRFPHVMQTRRKELMGAAVKADPSYAFKLAASAVKSVGPKGPVQERQAALTEVLTLLRSSRSNGVSAASAPAKPMLESILEAMIESNNPDIRLVTRASGEGIDAWPLNAWVGELMRELHIKLTQTFDRGLGASTVDVVPLNAEPTTSIVSPDRPTVFFECTVNRSGQYKEGGKTVQGFAINATMTTYRGGSSSPLCSRSYSGYPASTIAHVGGATTGRMQELIWKSAEGDILVDIDIDVGWPPDSRPPRSRPNVLGQDSVMEKVSDLPMTNQPPQ